MNTEVKAPPHIALRPCTSSQIAAFGHCPINNVLALQFYRKGENGERVPDRVDHYANVSAADYAEFCKAESKGKHFVEFIRNAKNEDGTQKFPHTKL